ncbi:MAG: hypothetical protein ABSH06_23570 [Thermodesulfobacteriota bacterium]|jgi:hypothetical protein
MGKLQEPSKNLTKRILTEVDFEDRLSGFNLRERAGADPVTMYSFEEVVSLLNDPHPRLDFNELEGWVRKTIKDGELADQIADAVSSGRSDQDRSLRIKKLMEERLSQCKRLAGRA